VHDSSLAALHSHHLLCPAVFSLSSLVAPTAQHYAVLSSPVAYSGLFLLTYQPSSPTSSMSHDHDLSRLHNPWEKFTHRDEKKHNAENDLAFRLGQPLYRLVPTPPPQPLSTRSTREVIDVFLDFGSKRLDDPVPRQRQLLKDFLLASDPPLPSLSSSRPATTYFDDVGLRSATGDIALIDDRNYHQYCARKVMQTCSDCYIYSQRLTIPELCNHLHGEVSYVKYPVITIWN
jgi:hypothetical protein